MHEEVVRFERSQAYPEYTPMANSSESYGASQIERNVCKTFSFQFPLNGNS